MRVKLSPHTFARAVTADQSGQAVVSYIMMIVTSISIFYVIKRFFEETNLGDKIVAQFTDTYRYNYQYGHPKARDENNGGPKYLPEFYDPNTDRYFVNPHDF